MTHLRQLFKLLTFLSLLLLLLLIAKTKPIAQSAAQALPALAPELVEGQEPLAEGPHI